MKKVKEGGGPLVDDPRFCEWNLVHNINLEMIRDIIQNQWPKLQSALAFPLIVKEHRSELLPYHNLFFMELLKQDNRLRTCIVIVECSYGNSGKS